MAQTEPARTYRLLLGTEVFVQTIRICVIPCMVTINHTWNITSLDSYAGSSYRLIPSGCETGYCGMANASNEKQTPFNDASADADFVNYSFLSHEV
jgi:hypothetical protein